MIIGVPTEAFPGEHRVALVPTHAASLRKAGFEIRVEEGAGKAAGFEDAQYSAQQIQIASRAEVLQSDMLLCVRAAGALGDRAGEFIESLRPNQRVLGFCEPLGEPQASQRAAERGVTLISMELVPRITRAQSMDALSSMATVAGYKAVLLAADSLPRMFPMMMTAAGTISPAKVLVIGAGVAGLQAIASSRRLGAVVTGYDVRPVVKEQVESLGARFLELPLETTAAQDQGGYAKAQSEEFYRKQQELLQGAVRESDVVITTAAVPGKRAPVLLSNAMLEGMKPGSVVVDVAAERGGNCEATVPGQDVLHHGVRIIGRTNLPSLVPYHASQLYSKNIVTLLLHLAPKGELAWNMDDEITRETAVARDGQVIHPRVRELLNLPPAGSPSGSDAAGSSPPAG